MSCCSYKNYNKAFDEKLAAQELGEYLQSGLKESSQPIMKVLENLSVKSKSLLDIGGGIGAITFELFKMNIQSATHIDISNASVKTFRSEVNRLSINDKVKSFNGDFLDYEQEISKADLVILDKVICCYKDYEVLVGKSIKKAQQWYVYSIPRETWYVKAHFFIESLKDFIKGKYFPIYYHPNNEIEKIIFSEGFRKKIEKIEGYWRVILFQR